MLKSIRNQKGLSQKELAEISGINIRMIQKYESGEYSIGNMTLRTALAIADALEVDVNALIPPEKIKRVTHAT